MDPKMVASLKLKSLQYDFRSFTIDDFIAWIEKDRGRRILMIPWKMPASQFGAWMTDGEQPTEYIFYRNDVPKIHQVHIQLHELAHLLLGHPTLEITSNMLGKSWKGTEELPFPSLTRLRSDEKSQIEAEAELLAGMIQEQVIRQSELRRLLEGGSSNSDVAEYLQGLGML